MKTIYTILTMALFAFLYLASNTPKRLTSSVPQYAEMQNESFDTLISYRLPQVDLASSTQTQKKGGVSIKVEMSDFYLEDTINVFRKAHYRNPNKPGYDVYEVTKRPHISINPEHIIFNVTILNEQDRVLKLAEVPIVLIVNEKPDSIRESSLVSWKAGMVIKNFEMKFDLVGPHINSLKEVNTLNVLIYDIPTKYDAAGYVAQKDNFAFEFNLPILNKQKKARVTFAYEDIRAKESTCRTCNGEAYFKTTSPCSNCRGNGYVLNKEGEKRNCFQCNGKGSVDKTTACTTCSGQGKIIHYQSQMPHKIGETEWEGFYFLCEITPGNTNLKILNSRSNQYETAFPNHSGRYRWMHVKGESPENYPVIVEYDGKEFKFIPIKESGTDASKVILDLTETPPGIQNGQFVE